MDTLNRRLLVLDDEPGVLDAYRVILEPSPAPAVGIVSSRRGAAAVAMPSPQPVTNFEVQYVSSGPETLRIIREAVLQKRPFTGGFFDVKLGGEMDGIECMRQAKDIDPHMCFVMVTAYQDRSLDDITQIFGEDFTDRWDFLTKPFSRNEILQKAKNLVAGWHRREREAAYLGQIQDQQNQIIQTERLAAVGTLARGIGHEFANILLGIVGRAELAIQKGGESQVEALKLIIKTAERAAVITRNLQTLVKEENAREPIDIREPLKETLQLVEHELKKTGVKVVEQFAPVIPTLNASRVEMGQVFLNLILNALHAMEETKGGTLTLKVATENNGVSIDVQDTGSGIAADVLPKIFMPLFTTKGKRGSGIGLSVTQKIVESHGGKIGVQSKEGSGSLFRVWLPKA